MAKGRIKRRRRLCRRRHNFKLKYLNLLEEKLDMNKNFITIRFSPFHPFVRVRALLALDGGGGGGK